LPVPGPPISTQFWADSVNAMVASCLTSASSTGEEVNSKPGADLPRGVALHAGSGPNKLGDAICTAAK
jgi:hypothetical protein